MVTTMPDSKALPILMKVREVSALLRVSRATVHALIDAGDLDTMDASPSTTTSQRKHVRITGKSILRFMQKRSNGNLLK